MICIPVKKNTLHAVLDCVRKAQRLGDIIEVWFDEIKDLNEENLGKIFSVKKKPFIYKTTKTKESKITDIIIAKTEYTDLDISIPQKFITKIRKLNPKIKIIISFHDFEATPSDKTLEKIASKIISKKADIVKIATFAQKFTDSIRMISLLEKLKAKGINAICLCMGKEGEITRTSGHLFGNYLMYASLLKSDKTADGQLTAKELKTIQLCL